MTKVVITHAKRTPIGSFNGGLSSLTAPQLGSTVIQALLAESQIDKNEINEVILGNVLSAGIGQAPARQAALFAGLPDKTDCLTINKMCGSGLKAIMLAHQAIASGDADVIIAGGQESMTNAPYLLKNGRNGYRLGNSTLYDSILLDGLTDVYNDVHMGVCAEACAREFNFTREDLDTFTVNSYKKALKAIESGVFEDEIIPVKIKSRSGETVFAKDEEPGKVSFEKIASLKPVFDKAGIITAANASSLNDGAAAVLMMSEAKAKELGYEPLAEIVAQVSASKAPIQFTTAPADAIQKVLAKAKLTKDQIDLYEINEAFAVVSLAVNKLVGLSSENINVNGGAVALGHPIGASGARIMTTLLYEMKRRKSTYGLASLCIGGGEASAVIVKRP